MYASAEQAASADTSCVVLQASLPHDVLQALVLLETLSSVFDDNGTG